MAPPQHDGPQPLLPATADRSAARAAHRSIAKRERPDTIASLIQFQIDLLGTATAQASDSAVPFRHAPASVHAAVTDDAHEGNRASTQPSPGGGTKKYPPPVVSRYLAMASPSRRFCTASKPLAKSRWKQEKISPVSPFPRS